MWLTCLASISLSLLIYHRGGAGGREATFQKLDLVYGKLRALSGTQLRIGFLSCGSTVCILHC